jgi:hypothetical protein
MIVAKTVLEEVNLPTGTGRFSSGARKLNGH